MANRNLASKGRYGDSEIRNVAGRTSHVNPREADIIDLWGALGESLVQRRGTGTRNPMTGMPEYPAGGFNDTGWDEDTQSWELGAEHYHDGEEIVYGSAGGGPSSDQHMREDSSITDDSTTIYTGGDRSAYEDIKAAIGAGEYREEYDFNNDGSLNILDIKLGQASGELDLLTEETVGGEDWKDLTQSQFQALMEGGNQEELIAGLDSQWTAGDFEDVFDETKLGFIQEGYDLQTGKLESDKTITGGILQSNLESAKGQYGRGLQAAGYNVGKSLFDVKQQVEGQQSKGGFAGSGFVAATGKRAQRGLFQDYRAQQRELSAGLGEAKTAFHWGTERMESDYEYGIDMAQLGKKTDIHDFWSDKHSAFYDRLSWLENQP